MLQLHLGDAIEKLKGLGDNSVDSVVTDPPYGLAFMNKKWDYDVPSVELWREVLRVLKPGGHLLSFGGTRTYHRMVVAIEDAGFEIRDQIGWCFGSGFPKSHNISKAIDKLNGDFDKRPVLGKIKAPRANVNKTVALGGSFQESPDLTSAASAASAAWEGWGTAIKPAWEPVCLARKPLERGLTVAENVCKWGTGAINVDGSRIEAGADLKPVHSGAKGAKQSDYGAGTVFGNSDKYTSHVSPQGRWPANLILDERAAEMLDAQSGQIKSGKPGIKRGGNTGAAYGAESRAPGTQMSGFGDSGGASRFFYVAKASKRERNAGLGNDKCTHPTVKPIKLMQYLIRMVTPPSGTVLDPFMGSGTTGCAARSLGFGFIGIEREVEYFEIAKRRIEHWGIDESEKADKTNDDQLQFSI